MFIFYLVTNDLAGDKIVVNPLVTANPCMNQIDLIEIPELYPGCAVTRAMANKLFQTSFEISLSDTFIVHLSEITSTFVHDQVYFHASDPSVSTSSKFF